jgi:hypothetical protein
MGMATASSALVGLNASIAAKASPAQGMIAIKKAMAPGRTYQGTPGPRSTMAASRLAATAAAKAMPIAKNAAVGPNGLFRYNQDASGLMRNPTSARMPEHRSRTFRMKGGCEVGSRMIVAFLSIALFTGPARRGRPLRTGGRLLRGSRAARATTMALPWHMGDAAGERLPAPTDR